MMELPTVSVQSLQKLFDVLPHFGETDEITASYIKAHVGCTDRNATGLVSVLNLLEMADQTHRLTDTWRAYLEKPREVLEKAIKKRYSVLYDRYGDDPKESIKAIEDTLQNKCKKGPDWAERAARDFQALRNIARAHSKTEQASLARSDLGRLSSGFNVNSHKITIDFPVSIVQDPTFFPTISKFLLKQQ